MPLSGHLRARKIWIDDALCRAARCRRVALRQRRVAAFVIGGPPAVHMQANRISRIVRLGPSRCRCQNRRDRQNHRSRNAHQSLLRDMRGASRPDGTGVVARHSCCGARTRSGQPCKSAPVTGRRRCRMHGGAAGSGAPTGSRNGNFRHGRYTKEVAAARRWIQEARKLLRKLK
jgi:hypothetical protein